MKSSVGRPGLVAIVSLLVLAASAIALLTKKTAPSQLVEREPGTPRESALDPIARGPREIASDIRSDSANAPRDPTESKGLRPDASVPREVEVLQAALESSVTGVLDVGALIESTLTLTDRPMTRPPTGASESNTQECPLKDLPAGVKKAEVWIGPANGPEGLRSLSLRIQLARRTRPYVVGGVERDDPELDLTIISDKTGKARECRVLTRLQVTNSGDPKANTASSRSDLIEGVACLFDATGTGKTSLSFLGTKDHRTRQWEAPMALVGSDPAGQWAALQESLWSRLQSTRN